MRRNDRIMNYLAMAGLSTMMFLTTETQSYASNQGIVVNTNNLNVRSGAGTNYSKIGTLSKGTKIDIIDTKNGWHQIKYNNTQGFVYSTYIEIVNNTTSQTDITYTGTVTANSLNVRQSASASSSKLGSLTKGSKVDIVNKESNGWYKIKYNNGYGYVSGSYISNVTKVNTNTTSSTVSNTSNSTTNSNITYTGIVTATSLNVRKDMTTNYAPIGSLTKGSKVDIVNKESNGWYKIKYNNGYGYVSGSYISNVVAVNTSSNEDTVDTSLPVLNTGKVVNTNSLNVRNGAGTSYSKIGSLTLNQTVEIVKTETLNGSVWYKIKYNNRYGYVSSSYIKINEESNSPTQETTPNDSSNNNTSSGDSTISKGTVHNTTWLTVRSGASVSSQALGSIPEGYVVDIIANENGWYKIKYNNTYGYVGGTYIKLGETDNGNDNTSTDSSDQINGTVSETTTNYEFTLDEYLLKQQSNNPSYYEVSYYKNYIDPALAKNKYQFLRIDTYREISKDMLNTKLKDKGVLEGQAEAIINACKKYNIDPIYFTSQSMHETNNGKSTLAKGVTITEIADTTKEIKDKNGNLIGYEMIKLDKPVTVYNLFGIGAYDNLSTFTNRALILGTTHAYKSGWTDIAKAIEGGAEYVSKNYIHSSKYKQNTVYKLRYNPSKTYMWHQYATSPWYAETIGNLMNNMKDCYTSNNTFTFDMPVYQK